MSEQRTARHDLGQRTINGRCLTTLLAAPACNARPHRAQPPEPDRHIIQLCRHIFADGRIGAATGSRAAIMLYRLQRHIAGQPISRSHQAASPSSGSRASVRRSSACGTQASKTTPASLGTFIRGSFTWLLSILPPRQRCRSDK